MITTKIKTILLIDDDEDDCMVFKMALSEAAPGVTLHYRNGCDAILIDINETNPDLIFLDINLPRITGIECLERLQQAGKIPAVPMIVYSSSELPRDLVAAYQKGAALYFRKPSNITQLIMSLEELIQLDWQQASAITNQYSGAGDFYSY